MKYLFDATVHPEMRSLAFQQRFDRNIDEKSPSFEIDTSVCFWRQLEAVERMSGNPQTSNVDAENPVSTSQCLILMSAANLLILPNVQLWCFKSDVCPQAGRAMLTDSEVSQLQEHDGLFTLTLVGKNCSSTLNSSGAKKYLWGIQTVTVTHSS